MDEFDEIEEEVVELLSDLIKFNTVNPPGNELEAAKFLAEKLREEGLEPEIIETAKGRGNLIARIKGSGEKPSLLLLSHLDVVPADPKEWSVEPFSGVLKDGFVWGRGALDCKSLVASEAMVMLMLTRKNIKLKGDLIFAATADEEKGGHEGVKWLVKNEFEKIKAEYVINEGGGFSFQAKRGRMFLIQTAEKAAFFVRIKSKGKPGHGSVPNVVDNAVIKMAEVIKRLGTYKPRIVVIPTVRLFIKEILKDRGFKGVLFSKLITNPLLADRILNRLDGELKGTNELFGAMLRMTMAPTIVHGGVKENVIPSECEGTFDCRLLPGQKREYLISELEKALKGIKKLEVNVPEAYEAIESPIDTELFETISKTLKEFEPDCSIVPYMITGSTDSRFLRRLGSVCYGFHPVKPDMPLGSFMRMVHGIDERIAIKDLVFGTKVLYRLVKNFLC
ncbi:MAG: M20/M25/M40 family metallo-hydrolase [Candidatus Bathyarchaeia archaeon]